MIFVNIHIIAHGRIARESENRTSNAKVLLYEQWDKRVRRREKKTKKPKEEGKRGGHSIEISSEWEQEKGERTRERRNQRTIGRWCTRVVPVPANRHCWPPPGSGPIHRSARPGKALGSKSREDREILVDLLSLPHLANVCKHIPIHGGRTTIGQLSTRHLDT